jgi:glycosyltransferase involved in cell wall biosynthesis
LIPVFNDWAALAQLLPQLDDALHQHALRADVLIVDDGSTEPPPADFLKGPFQALGRIDLLPLRRNLGHQRAITVGLAYVHDQLAPPAVIVMDADGEDDPRDVPRLLQRCSQEGGERLVFAERTKRSESWAFRLSYGLYKVGHYLLTGYRVRVGNFSVVPRPQLARLVTIAEMWNHYAAAAIKSRLPFVTVPTRRARRLHGPSKMDFIQLALHGLSALAVYGDLIVVRLLLATLLLSFLMGLTLAGLLGLWLLTDRAVPGWAVIALGAAETVLLQGAFFFFLVSVLILGNRQSAMFLPLRDYVSFTGPVQTVWPSSGL